MPYADPKARAAMTAAWEEKTGMKQVSVRMDPDTRQLLADAAKRHGSKQAAVKAALEIEAARAAGDKN